jgi:thiol-disulfide isomerase/thioredoxin
MNRISYRFCLVVLAIVMAVAGADPRAQFSPEKYGMGATITRADTTSPFAIHSCAPGGPADRAGLLAGDHISKLDGKSVETWSFGELLGHLIREEPTPLRITVLRNSAALSVELVRARFSDIATGQGFRWISSSDSLGYMIVPLEERDTLGVGSVLGPVGLYNTQCKDQEVRLQARGETLLYFWASWCGPCKLLMKELDDSRQQLAESGLRLIGVNVDRSCDVFVVANDTIRAPGEQYWAGGYYGDLAQALRVYRRGIPTGALFDEGGRLVTVKTGVYSVFSLVDSAACRVER